jgi:hypothetical protein
MVTLPRSLQQETTAAKFNVIGVRPDGKNIHHKE